jgi:hypothetical protein
MLSAPIVRDVLKAYYDKKARLGIANSPGIARTARPVEQVPDLPSAAGPDKVKPATPTAPNLTGE